MWLVVLLCIAIIALSYIPRTSVVTMAVLAFLIWAQTKGAIENGPGMGLAGAPILLALMYDIRWRARRAVQAREERLWHEASEKAIIEHRAEKIKERLSRPGVIGIEGAEVDVDCEAN